MCEIDNLNGGFVPTGHNLTHVLNRFLEFREGGGQMANMGEFVQWEIDTLGRAQGGAAADWYPLRDSQLAFGRLSLPDLEAVTRNPSGYRSGQILRGCVPSCLQDACQTIKSAFVMGVYRREELTNPAIQQDLLARGFAGTPNAAQAIHNVGQAFLRHFGLVDEHGIPNSRFALLFRC